MDAAAPSPSIYIVYGEGGMGTGKHNSIRPSFTLLLASVGDANTTAFARRVGVGLGKPCLRVAPLHAPARQRLQKLPEYACRGDAKTVRMQNIVSMKLFQKRVVVSSCPDVTIIH